MRKHKNKIIDLFLIILTVLFIWALATSENAEGQTIQYVYQAVNRNVNVASSFCYFQSSCNIIGTGAQYHQLSWNVSGSVSACSVQVDSSSDGVIWSSGGIIAAQVCTSNGNITSSALTVNFVRVTITSFIGAGNVTTNLTGYANNPSGGGSGCVGTCVTSMAFSGSLTSIPNPVIATGTATLVNDSSTPGASMYYGTNAGGTKGFFALPSGSSITFQANGSPLANQTTINFLNSSGAGEVDFTNPSVGQVVATLHNTSFTLNTITCTLAGTCNLPEQVNTVNLTSQVGFNFLNSSTNAVGLSATVSNPGTNQIRLEITGGSYTGNAATSTQFALVPTQCTGGQFSTGVQANGNSNCGTPSGSGTVVSGAQFAAAYYSTNPTGTTVSASNVGITGQSYISTNAAAPAFKSPGIADGNGGTAITTTPYPVACDSSTSILDRSHVLRLQTGASVVNAPDSTGTGCTGNMSFKLFNDGAGNVTVNRGGTDTFTIVDGTIHLTSQTSFVLHTGQTALVNNGAAGLWEVTLSPQFDGSTITDTNGIVSCTTATGSQIGCVKPDGTSITISSGVISATGNGTVSSGTATHFAYYASTGTTVSDLGTDLTYTAGSHTFATSSSAVWDYSSASSFKVKTAAGYAPTTAALFGYDSTNNDFVGGNGTATFRFAVASSSGTNTTCTNQVFTVISAVAAPTCTTLTASFMPGALAIANTTFTTATTAVASNTCDASATTVTLTGLTTSMTLQVTPTADTSGITGWGATGGLILDMWPSATNTVSYKRCNQTGSSITPGAVTFNLSAR